MSTIHATALLVGERALLIRGGPGSGKSSLALSLIREAQNMPGQNVRLIADDRVHTERFGSSLLARAPEPIAGMIEERARGIVRVPYEPCGVVAAVIDIAEAARMPAPEDMTVEIDGTKVPRFFQKPQASLSLAKAQEIIGKTR